MAKLIIRESAKCGIEGATVIKKMTNKKYDQISKSADIRIEKNNRDYIDTYKKATLYTAK
jgi:predicted transcriptional regulator